MEARDEIKDLIAVSEALNDTKIIVEKHNQEMENIHKELKGITDALEKIIRILGDVDFTSITSKVNEIQKKVKSMEQDNSVVNQVLTKVNSLETDLESVSKDVQKLVKKDEKKEKLAEAEEKKKPNKKPAAVKKAAAKK